MNEKWMATHTLHLLDEKKNEDEKQNKKQ